MVLSVSVFLVHLHLDQESQTRGRLVAGEGLLYGPRCVFWNF